MKALDGKNVGESHAMTTLDLLCFHMYKPQSNLKAAEEIYSCRAQKKKLIELSFQNPVAPAGMVRLRFEQGLLEVCTYEKPACQSFAT